MGITVGYTHKCNKCGANLDDDINFFLYRLNPIDFDYIIKYCPNCSNKYLSNHKEFFTVTKKDFYISLISSMLTWLFILLIIAIIILDSFDYYDISLLVCLLITVLFVPLYYVLFKHRWNNAIKESKKRLDDEEYLYNLYLFNIFSLDDIIKFKDIQLISSTTFNDFMYNVNHSKDY